MKVAGGDFSVKKASLGRWHQLVLQGRGREEHHGQKEQ